jgi:transposase
MGFLRSVFGVDEGSGSQREYRVLFNALRWFIRAGCPWRMMPNDLPPWQAVQQPTQRWLRAGCFEAMVHDLRVILRAGERDSAPSAAILDSRTYRARSNPHERIHPVSSIYTT